MQAEGIKAGDRSETRTESGKLLSGWTATGDAVVEGNTVYVPVKHWDGGDGTRVYPKGTQVPLVWGAGGPPPKQALIETAVCNACGWEAPAGDRSAVLQVCPKCRQDDVNFFTPGGVS